MWTATNRAFTAPLLMLMTGQALANIRLSMDFMLVIITGQDVSQHSQVQEYTAASRAHGVTPNY
jgi:hypothetical protein